MRGSPDAAVALVREVVAEIGPTYGPLGDQALIGALIEAIPLPVSAGTPTAGRLLATGTLAWSAPSVGLLAVIAVAPKPAAEASSEAGWDGASGLAS